MTNTLVMAAPKGNAYAIGNAGGRPPFYESPYKMEQKIIQYFQECIDNEENPKITQLVLFLGFCDLSSFYDYEKKEEFAHIIKRARTAVACSYESLLTTVSLGGAIFALKNMGWKDKTEVDNTHHFDVQWNETKTYEPPTKREETEETQP